MKSIQAIIDKWGGIEKLKNGDYYIKLKKPGFSDLVIEYVGDYMENPEFPIISVAHYYKQNGDMMRDPEITFIVSGTNWQPLTYQQDGLGLYQELVFEQNGRTMVRPKALESCKSFCKLWDRNIKDQKWLDVPVNSAVEASLSNPDLMQLTIQTKEQIPTDHE